MGTNEDNYNVTILVAEDEESNFLLLKTILKRHCNVLQARTGLELLRIFEEKNCIFCLGYGLYSCVVYIEWKSKKDI